MKVVVTGGAGFLGQRLLRRLCARGRLTDAGGVEREIRQIVAIDQAHAKRLFVDERIGYVIGDISVPTLLTHVLANDSASVFHLAAANALAAQDDFDLGMRVNLDGTRALLEACRSQRAPVRFVFSSSVMVFDAPLPAVVGDDTAAWPQTRYGTQKLLGELLVAGFTRDALIDGRALRLPIIAPRPGSASGAVADFASAILREPLAGAEAVCPVAADTPLYLLSPAAAVDALIHAHELPQADWLAVTGGHALNPPGLTVTVGELIEALRRAAGEAVAGRVRLAPDERIAAIVRRWPARFAAARAQALGFRADDGIDAILCDYLAATAAEEGGLRRGDPR